MPHWGRLITAMVTPFSDNLEVNYEQAIVVAQKLEREGSAGLVICGTTGEAPTLTAEEKFHLIKTVKENVRIPVIAGVGTNATDVTIENGKQAIEAGADGLLVVTPYYNKPDQDSLYEHFKTIALAIKHPMMLYNVPGRTGINMLPTTVERLSRLENIVALKEAGGNLVQLSETIKRVPKDFMVYTGDDALTLPCISVGAYGVVSVAAHIVGIEMKALIDAYLRGDVENAGTIHIRLLDIFNTLFIAVNPVPVKHALNLMGYNVGALRMPLMEANHHVQAEVKRCLQELQLINE
ncbi:MAG: 4-hydroxy-tetrahydrodipicolinate synthase [Bacillota bacterium]